jgi:hypothetical protein
MNENVSKKMCILYIHYLNFDLVVIIPHFPLLSMSKI